MEDAFVSFVSSCLLEPEREPATSKHPTEEEDTGMAEESIVEFLPYSHDAHLVSLRDRAFSWDVNLENDKVHPDLLLGSVIDHNIGKSVYRPKVFQNKDGHLDDIRDRAADMHADESHDSHHLLLDDEGELFGDDLLPSGYGLQSGPFCAFTEAATSNSQSGPRAPRARIRVTLKAESPAPANAGADRKGGARKRTDSKPPALIKKEGPLSIASSAGGSVPAAAAAAAAARLAGTKTKDPADTSVPRPGVYHYSDMAFQQPVPTNPTSSSSSMVVGGIGLGSSSSASSMHMSISSMSMPSSMSSMAPTTMTMGSGGSDRRVGAYTIEERRIKIEKFRERKRQRIWRKQIKYDCRKRLADTRPRVKGRFVSRKKMNLENGGDEQEASEDDEGEAAGAQGEDDDGEKESSILPVQKDSEGNPVSYLNNPPGLSNHPISHFPPAANSSYMLNNTSSVVSRPPPPPQPSTTTMTATTSGSMMNVSSMGSLSMPSSISPSVSVTNNTYTTIGSGIVPIVSSVPSASVMAPGITSGMTLTSSMTLAPCASTITNPSTGPLPSAPTLMGMSSVNSTSFPMSSMGSSYDGNGNYVGVGNVPHSKAPPNSGTMQ